VIFDDSETGIGPLNPEWRVTTAKIRAWIRAETAGERAGLATALVEDPGV